MKKSSVVPLGLVLCCLSADHATGQTVRGRLLESPSRRGIGNGFVALATTAGSLAAVVVTNRSGEFALAAPAAGSYLVVASAFGYSTKVDGVLDVGEGGEIEIEFFLKPRPIDLSGIIATVERTRTERFLEASGFYERQKMGFGFFITPEELAARQPFDAADLLRRAPGISVEDNGVAGQTVYCDGGIPTVYVDGVKMHFPPILATLGGSPVDLSQVGPVEDLAGLEVFRGSTQIPLQYGGAGARCVMLIWTKH